MTAISTTTPSQPAVNTAAFAQIAPTLFAMDTMVTRWADQLKMPRPDAYDLVVTGIPLWSISTLQFNPTEISIRFLASMETE